MKYTEALLILRKHPERYFEATHEGDKLQLWGDLHQCYIFDVQCLEDVGMPWFVFDLDWIEVTEK